MNTINVGLCRGRHEIKNVDDYIFDFELNPLDVEGITNQAKNFMTENKIKKINLYVTGLTVALVSVINVCIENDIDLTLYHFDRQTAEYYPQKIYKK